MTDDLEVVTETTQLVASKVSWFPPALSTDPPTPLIKMPGSKRWLCPALQHTIPKYLAQTEGRFFEPFAGSAALALCMGARGCKTVISDANADLMRILAAAKASPADYWHALEQWVAQGIEEADYLAARGFAPATAFSQAVRALYLARLSFNGLWRVNSSGGFNVPYGKAATRAFPSLEAVYAVSKALETAEVYSANFQQTIAQAGPGDVLFADPPYLGTFTAYTAAGFTELDTAETAVYLKQAAKRGAVVIVTSPQDPAVAVHYEWAYNIALGKRHIVAAKAEARVTYPEAIYTNEPDLVDLAALGAYLDATPVVDEPEGNVPTD